MRVLVVEDEERLAANIAAGLREGADFAVDIAQDGEEALGFCSTEKYDLIVLDLMLPRVPGREVLTRVRAARVATPILVLTAVTETIRKIELFNHGADDYLTKPFDLGELIARCRALIRRGKGVSHPVLEFHGLRMDTAEQSVACGEIVLDLSPTEYRILEYLMFKPRVIVSKRELLEHLYDFRWEHHSNVIEVHISNLRKKLRSCAGTTGVETLRGRGYRLAQ